MHKKLLTNLLFVSIVLGAFAAVAVPRAEATVDPLTKAIAGPVGAYFLDKVSNSALETTTSWTMNTVMSVMARGLAITGWVFDQSLDWSLNFGKILAQVPVVDIGWKVLRDIANIAFIFIALWSGISITLGINAEKAWGLLAQMVLVALFINFSLFITKTVIDASNIAALHFYRLMVANPCPANASSCVDAQGNDTLPQLGISTAFMNGLKLQTLYDSKLLGKDVAVAGSIAATAPKPQLHAMNILLIGVFGSIFMLIAAFVFLAAAIMFVIRTVTLMMLMLLSPLAFVAWLLPGAQGLASEWWHKLWSQAFFAPLYMALAYVVVATIQSPEFSTYLRDASFAAALTSNGAAPGSMGIIFNFVIMSALLIGCLLVAQKLGATGSGMVMKLGAKLAGAASGLAGRNTLGRIGEKLGKSETFKKLTGGDSAFGKAVRGVTSGALYGAKFGSGASRKSVTVEAKREDEEKKRKDADVAKSAAAANLITTLKSGAPIPAGTISGLSPEMLERVAAQDPTVLANPAIAQQLNTKQLQRLTDSLSPAHKRAIRASIMSGPVGTHAHRFMTAGPGSMFWV